MPICQCDDLNIYYQIHGVGPALLLVSGLSGGTWSWSNQVPYFKTHYRTIIFDNRGAGRSSMPPGPYHMGQFAADALCLLDHLQVQQAFVLGLSMGGMIAQELALLAPLRVRALVLGCTHCGGEERIPPTTDVLTTFVNNEGLSQEQIIDKNLPFFFSAECRATRPAVIEAYRKVQLSAPVQPPHAFHAQLEAIRTFASGARLKQLVNPTLIVTGTKDLLVPPQNAHRLKYYLPRAKLAEVPGAGHALHFEAAAQLNELSYRFFSRYQEDKAESTLAD